MVRDSFSQRLSTPRFSEQKRAIFYDNAARFLRLTSEDIAAHHRMGQ
jgi:predicted TIM-barrel fold metal-dependent hydrolase